jgi:hypothetical protein
MNDDYKNELESAAHESARAQLEGNVTGANAPFVGLLPAEGREFAALDVRQTVEEITGAHLPDDANVARCRTTLRRWAVRTMPDES